MSFILLHIAAPMQSWGSRSRFEYRDTEREPTFSGIVGLIAAAMGIERSEDISFLCSLEMTVRVDREGILQQEFQTAQGVLTASGTKQDQLIHRDFLSDAEFHVALEGEETLLRRIFDALSCPVYPPFFGRKSYVPSCPILYPEMQSLFLTNKSPEEILEKEIPISRDFGMRLTLDLECETDESDSKSVMLIVPDKEKRGETRLDIPGSFDIYKRTYKTRYVKTIYRNVKIIG